MSRTAPSIQRYLLTRTFLFSAIGFMILLFVCRLAYEASIRDSADQIAESVAESTFNSMYLVMSQGWTRAQLEQFMAQLSSSKDSDAAIDVMVYRGEKVVDLYGEIDQPNMDKQIRDAMRTGEVIQRSFGNQQRYLHPLKAEQICLQCHTNASVGDTLGVIEVEQDLSKQMDIASRNLLYYLLVLSPLPILFGFWAVRSVAFRVNHSVDELSKRIRKVETLEDLSQLSRDNEDLGFRELNQIFGQVETLADRLQGIAVDKDLLEFEIRLLEKFVITSEVVRDWREYINMLMLDINQVIQIYTMFSIFKVDDEVFDLEIFWLTTPSDNTRKMMEKAIRKRLAGNEHFGLPGEVIIHHNSVSTDSTPLELEPAEIELQTKSLLVETPKIGGIVGIGVHASIVKDNTKVLVLESILSTLLNVVGSVKAIYKYTRDLEYYATRDPLTNLYNQRMFWELLDYELDRCQRHDYQVALLMLDLDNFKAINDGYGHATGDKLLRQLSMELQSVLRTGDILARYGGDEFVVVLPETSLEHAEQVSERLLQCMQDFSLETRNDGVVRVTGSIGVGLFPDHADNRKDLFMFVDNLMYRSKSQGKNRISLPHKDDVAEIFNDLNQKMVLVNDAIENHSVVPVFQPIQPNGDDLPAVEVLSRIQLPDDTLMTAGEFIEIAESMGKVHLMDYIVMEKAFERVRDTGYQGLLFINLSPRSILVRDFLQTLHELTDRYQLDRSRIVFEITERDTVKNMGLLENFVRNLKDAGYLLAIDDFGSGFSSFHYLKYLPIDFVKIEGDFIANMANDPRDLAFVVSITDLAKKLKLKTVAEFVENEDVLNMVREVGIDYAQGFHVGRPNREMPNFEVSTA
ncbi:putative bifunctional diguanylate cyclase/phosphodiesterase [Marinobacter persicus]|uniref:Diguanylate cyclase/phosphodiesterase n=1 Tax=Marinobacter persicus TaxID=930118 RepID=A0A2S6G719_9GAMM|nr:EAL domain-containing protein [Marinobacter persicus]PPK51926.1 diguanylate cyclase/phosphodiesterase [Marinobacter persicus]PPK54962.1 diguanylate cyclase/phosphodiesterase [Marinobacter persicus]PPK58323.1 diguanylate cyclase/phosphodiesterase [Marinobacter persicus]